MRETRSLREKKAGLLEQGESRLGQNGKRLRRVKKKLVSISLAAAVAACFGAWTVAPALAAENTPYSYTIRIYSGARGTYNAERTIEAKAGDRITFYPEDDTTVTDDKYYVKGIREAGLDNNEAESPSSIIVTEDKDYVIAYGIKGTTVAYTINYRDAAGNTLTKSRTYYGNVGDKPVMAYLYIDGYRPQAYNLTKTLSENAADNQLTFVYSKNEGTVTTTTTTTTNTTTTTAGRTGTTAGAGASGRTGSAGGTGTAGSTTDGTASGGTDAAGGTGTAGGSGTTGDTGAAGTGSDATGTDGADVDTAAAEPVEILDLDDEGATGSVDAAAPDDQGISAGEEGTINDSQPPKEGLSTAAKAGISVIIAAAIVAVIIALAMRARKKKQEDEA